MKPLETQGSEKKEGPLMLCGVNMRATAVVFTAFVFATALIAQQTVVPRSAGGARSTDANSSV